MGRNHPEAREIRIMMIGETGVGKSTFITRAAGIQVLPKEIVGNDILPFTKIVEEFEIKDARRQTEQWTVRLVDTPGLNDTYASDDHQLSMITKWLKNKSRLDRQATIDGIIYLCDINHRSLTSINANKLSQPPVVLFVIVKENEIEPSVMESRRAALTMKFSQFAVDRFDNTTESAWRLIDKVITLSSNPGVSLSAFQSNLENICNAPKPVKKKRGILRGFFGFLFKTG